MPLAPYVDAQSASPNAKPASVAMCEKGLAFEMQTVGLAAAHSRAAS